MAKQRYINTFFWDDSYIEDLCPHGKLLFIYLISTPLTNIAGSFEITVKKMSDHTGLSRDEITELLKRFEADDKVIYRDRWILMVNAIDHQSWRTHETIRTGINTIVSGSPQWVKDRLCIAYEWLSHLNLNSNLNLNSKNGETPVAAVAAVETSIDKWTDIIELLKTHDKMTEAQARPFLGRLAKQYSDQTLSDAIAVTLAQKPADTKAFLIGVLRERSGDNYRQKGQVGKDRGIAFEPDPPCRFCGAECCLKNHRAEIEAEAEKRITI